MARPVVTDFLHKMRFHAAIIAPTTGIPTLVGDGGASGSTEAGFTNVDEPSLAVAPVSYKEGQHNYARKYPGVASVGAAIKMSRGVSRVDTAFYRWARQTAEGAGSYRADVRIWQYHRDNVLTRKYDDGPAGNQTVTAITKETKAARIFTLWDAFPVGFSAGSGLDGTAGDIDIQELTVEYEYFDLELDGAKDKAP